MRLLLTFFILVAAILAVPPEAKDEHLLELRTGAEAKGWDGVGRLFIAGRSTCTGALIEDDLVLTAAHCVLHPDSHRLVAPEQMVFMAGLRNGRPTAKRSAIAVASHPEFILGENATTKTISQDVALIRLSSPISNINVEPFQLAERPRKGETVSVVSYGKNRQDTPVLQDACHVLARWSAVLVLSCNVEKGSSGAPVFKVDAMGVPSIVSVISSGGVIRGRDVAFGTGLTAQVSLVRGLLNAQESHAEFTQSTTPNVTSMSSHRSSGAKFVRP